MSKVKIYIKTPSYLTQWLKHEYWDAETQSITFPRGSVENIIMELYLRKTPKSGPRLRCEGDLAVAIPTSAYKKAEVYSHMPDAAMASLVSAIKKRFKKMMWEELHRIFPEEVQITDIVYAFMEKHGIEDIDNEFGTIRQMYFRMRKVYEKKDN